MDPVNQQEFLNMLVEFSNPEALIKLVIHLRNLRQEQKIMEHNMKEKQKAIQHLRDVHYIATHTYCKDCGAPPRKRLKVQSEEQDEENRHVRQSKL